MLSVTALKQGKEEKLYWLEITDYNPTCFIIRLMKH